MIDHIKNRLQSLLGVTTSEIGFVALLAAGLIIGAAWRSVDSGQPKAEEAEIYQRMDSLAEAHRTTYTGSDIAGSEIPELAAADTIVEPDNPYPKKPKKESPGIININTASKVQLMKLPGVGDKTALKIIEYRKNQPFAKPEDIKNIKGIGQKKFEKMQKFISTDK
ncbi:MAG: ComEA family DNA-binding protein [Candidatus Kapaibacterium sp.]